MSNERTYIAIDLKSFYASVECVERQLDPLTTHLVVADAERTEKTICLAVSPSLKSYGIPGRARLFEVVQRVRKINVMRKNNAPGGRFSGSSYSAPELEEHPDLELSYLIAPPRMNFYLEYSTMIYRIYLKYIAPEDIHVYSIDEVFMDVTGYLKAYRSTPKELASKIIRDVLDSTGITATAGIGTNLYLCKVAMDIVAKHVEPDEHGVRIAQLDEIRYRKLLWNHRPLTDFWRVGHGYQKKLEAAGLFTMGDIARCSLGGDNELYNEELLYDMFGVNAELLIDHAWGREPVTIADIKNYRPRTNCLTSGQVLGCDYPFDKGLLVVKEMMDLLCLDLVEKNLVTRSVTLHVGYSNRLNIPSAHGTTDLQTDSNSDLILLPAVTALYKRIVNPEWPIHRINITCNHVMPEEYHQYNFFVDAEELEKNRKVQEAVISIKHKFGKDAILKGMNLEEGATTRERNHQIGGHRSGE